ncbi:MAG TPA: ABC transporter substrate-binding protein [Candidatus Baltobacteraceae bacterium]|nr:ABC transporter substrate-binding protein [Candidatus Baltobacteraceae bacterium]
MGKVRLGIAVLVFAVTAVCPWSAAFGAPSDGRAPAGEELMVADSPVGHPGGRLVIALRSEPKTLNPVLATDAASQEVIRCVTADLIDIDRATQKTEPALAKSWTVSRDGKQYTLRLRRGIRFSDGQPLTADDVVFSFQLYLDEKIDSPQRDLLIVGGKPIAVEKIDSDTVRFTLAQPYAAADRLFDGFAILPRHLLESAYRSGSFSQAFGVSMQPSQFAGLGPFRLKEYAPGERIVLERNPYYWKQDRSGTRLPYLNEIVFLFVASEDAQAIRFQAGDTDILDRFSAENFAVLEKQQAAKHYHLDDLGPGLEYNFLFFNLNDLGPKASPDIARKQIWFEDVRFRQAVSAAIDREAIVRLVYNGRATPLWTQVTPGNKLWIDPNIPHPARSLSHARDLLKAAGFSWRSDGTLLDPKGAPVEFSILTSSSNAQRVKIATLIQDDLSQLGMNVHVVSLEFHAMVDRLLNSHDYEAAVMGLASGDADPTSEMNVWMSNGDTHLWHPNETKPATPWEAQIDRLMEQQLVTLHYAKRKQLYDKVQEIIAENSPFVCLVSPNILVGASDRVGNFQPAILDPYTLWNIDELYVR